MYEFPRTTVGGISLSRLIIGINWFVGYSHISAAKDSFIKTYQTQKNIADILTVFLKNGVDTIMGLPFPILLDAINDAQNRTGKNAIKVWTPTFNLLPGGPPEKEPERVFDEMKEKGASICMPHQAMTDALVDRMHGVIRNIDRYTAMIRERDMIPGLSTHMPETPRYADETGLDVATYNQIYNAAGFMMQVEIDWVHRVIWEAKKPVIVIKPLAAGSLLPLQWV